MSTSSIQWHSRQSLGVSGVEVEPCLGAYIVRLLGEHDLTTAASIARTIDMALEVADVVVDLDSAEFIDAAIIHTFIRANRAATEAGRQFRLALSPTHPLRHTFDLADHGIEAIPGASLQNGKPSRRSSAKSRLATARLLTR